MESGSVDMIAREDTVPCQHGWDYDMEGYHVSLTVEQDWVDTGCQATPCHLSHETTAAGV